MVAAFGLPEVATVDDLPLSERKSWAVQLHRLIEQQAAKNGGLRPYPVQQQDILRMAQKSSARNSAEKSAVGATQLSLTALFQRLGGLGETTRGLSR
ncbi:MAG: hypothetical protein JXA33_16985 [Anaerolineae bacterium]|nr:hypothetical protein [Anaerolineae bacterium]